MRSLGVSLLLFVLVALVAAQPSMVGAASSNVNVTFTVASATVLDTAGCLSDTSGITRISSLPGTASVTASDCVVDFGSTNDTAALQVYQEDGTGTALAGPGDRSATWTALTSGTTEHLRALAALPDGRIWASGYNASLIYSANGGNTWTPQANPADNTLRDLYAVDSNVIWGTGWTGNVIRTVDGGANWTQVGKIAPIGVNDVRGGVRALDSQTAWVGSSGGTVFKTTNGGASWTTYNTGGTGLLWGMALVGTNTVWVVGEDGHIAKSTDGGVNWTLQRQVMADHYYRIDALDAQNAIVSGLNGMVLVTSDGGTTWQDRSAPTASTLDGVKMFSTSHWIVVGFNGVIYETRNAGSSWQLLPSGTAGDLRAFWAPDEVSMWVVGQGGLALRAPVTPINDYDDAANVDFATPGAGFFGACLRVAEAGAGTDGTTWTPNAACPASDGAWWNDIPPTSGSAGITIARTAAPTPVGSPARVRLRFAGRPPAAAAPGQYRARLIVAVIAPG